MRFLDDLIIGLEAAAWFIDAALETAIDLRRRLRPERDEPTLLKLPEPRRSRLATAFAERRAA